MEQQQQTLDAARALVDEQAKEAAAGQATLSSEAAAAQDALEQLIEQQRIAHTEQIAVIEVGHDAVVQSLRSSARAAEDDFESRLAASVRMQNASDIVVRANHEAALQGLARKRRDEITQLNSSHAEVVVKLELKYSEERERTDAALAHQQELRDAAAVAASGLLAQLDAQRADFDAAARAAESDHAAQREKLIASQHAAVVDHQAQLEERDRWRQENATKAANDLTDALKKQRVAHDKRVAAAESRHEAALRKLNDEAAQKHTHAARAIERQTEQRDLAVEEAAALSRRLDEQRRLHKKESAAQEAANDARIAMLETAALAASDEYSHAMEVLSRQRTKDQGDAAEMLSSALLEAQRVHDDAALAMMAEHDEAVKATRSRHDALVESLQQQHKDGVATDAAAHDAQLRTVNDKHAARLAVQSQGHAEERAVLEADFDRRIVVLTADAREALAESDVKLAATLSEMAQLRTNAAAAAAEHRIQIERQQQSNAAALRAASTAAAASSAALLDAAQGASQRHSSALAEALQLRDDVLVKSSEDLARVTRDLRQGHQNELADLAEQLQTSEGAATAAIARKEAALEAATLVEKQLRVELLQTTRELMAKLASQETTSVEAAEDAAAAWAAEKVKIEAATRAQSRSFEERIAASEAARDAGAVTAAERLSTALAEQRSAHSAATAAVDERYRDAAATAEAAAAAAAASAAETQAELRRTAEAHEVTAAETLRRVQRENAAAVAHARAEHDIELDRIRAASKLEEVKAATALQVARMSSLNQSALLTQRLDEQQARHDEETQILVSRNLHDSRRAAELHASVVDELQKSGAAFATGAAEELSKSLAAQRERHVQSTEAAQALFTERLDRGTLQHENRIAQLRETAAAEKKRALADAAERAHASEAELRHSEIAAMEQALAEAAGRTFDELTAAAAEKTSALEVQQSDFVAALAEADAMHEDNVTELAEAHRMRAAVLTSEAATAAAERRREREHAERSEDEQRSALSAVTLKYKRLHIELASQKRAWAHDAAAAETRFTRELSEERAHSEREEIAAQRRFNAELTALNTAHDEAAALAQLSSETMAEMGHAHADAMATARVEHAATVGSLRQATLASAAQYGEATTTLQRERDTLAAKISAVLQTTKKKEERWSSETARVGAEHLAQLEAAQLQLAAADANHLTSMAEQRRLRDEALSNVARITQEVELLHVTHSTAMAVAASEAADRERRLQTLGTDAVAKHVSIISDLEAQLAQEVALRETEAEAERVWRITMEERAAVDAAGVIAMRESLEAEHEQALLTEITNAAESLQLIRKQTAKQVHAVTQRETHAVEELTTRYATSMEDVKKRSEEAVEAEAQKAAALRAALDDAKAAAASQQVAGDEASRAAAAAAAASAATKLDETTTTLHAEAAAAAREADAALAVLRSEMSDFEREAQTARGEVEALREASVQSTLEHDAESHRLEEAIAAAVHASELAVAEQSEAGETALAMLTQEHTALLQDTEQRLRSELAAHRVESKLRIASPERRYQSQRAQNEALQEAMNEESARRERNASEAEASIAALSAAQEVNASEYEIVTAAKDSELAHLKDELRSEVEARRLFSNELRAESQSRIDAAEETEQRLRGELAAHRAESKLRIASPERRYQSQRAHNEALQEAMAEESARRERNASEAEASVAALSAAQEANASRYEIATAAKDSELELLKDELRREVEARRLFSAELSAESQSRIDAAAAATDDLVAAMQTQRESLEAAVEAKHAAVEQSAEAEIATARAAFRASTAEAEASTAAAILERSAALQRVATVDAALEETIAVSAALTAERDDALRRVEEVIATSETVAATSEENFAAAMATCASEAAELKIHLAEADELAEIRSADFAEELEELVRARDDAVEESARIAASMEMDAARWERESHDVEALFTEREAEIKRDASDAVESVTEAHRLEVASLSAKLDDLAHTSATELESVASEHETSMAALISRHDAAMATQAARLGEVHAATSAEHSVEIEAHLEAHAAAMEGKDRETEELSSAVVELHLEELKALQKKRDKLAIALKRDRASHEAKVASLEASHAKQIRALENGHTAKLRGARAAVKQVKDRTKTALAIAAEEHKAKIATLDSTMRNEMSKSMMRRESIATERSEANAKRIARQKTLHDEATLEAEVAQLRLVEEHAVAKRDAVALEERHAELVASHDEVASHAAELRTSESALKATIAAQKVEHAAALDAVRAAQTRLEDELAASTEAVVAAQQDGAASATRAREWQTEHAATTQRTIDEHAAQAEQLRVDMESHATERDAALVELSALQSEMDTWASTARLGHTLLRGGVPATPPLTPPVPLSDGPLEPPPPEPPIDGPPQPPLSSPPPPRRGVVGNHRDEVTPLRSGMSDSMILSASPKQRRKSAARVAMDRRVNEQLASPRPAARGRPPLAPGGGSGTRSPTFTLRRSTELRYQNIVVVKTSRNAIEIAKPIRFKSGLPRTRRHVEIEDDCVADFAAITAQLGRAIVEIRRAHDASSGDGAGAGADDAGGQLHYLISGHTAADAKHFNRARPVEISADRAECVRTAVLDSVAKYAAELKAAATAVVEGGGGGEERALDLDVEGIAQCVWAKGYGGAFPIGDADDAEAMKLRSRRVEIFVGSAEEVQTLLGVDVEGYAKPLPQRVAEGVATFAERVLPTSLGVGAASSGAGAVGAPAAAPTPKVGRDRTRRSSLIELSAKAKASLDRDVQSLGQDPHLAQHARREEQRAALCKDEPEVLELHAQIPALGKQAFATMDVRNVGVVSVKDALSMYSRLGVDDRGVAGTSWKVSRVVWRVLLLSFSSLYLYFLCRSLSQ